MAQESRYLRLLTVAGSYRVSAGIEGRKVDFFDQEGTRILEFGEMPDPGNSTGSRFV
jgi:hypothetical protein